MVTAGQCLHLGLSYSALGRLVRQEHWARASPGLYDTAPAASGFEKRAWGAFLVAGEGAAIGGDAALRLAGLDREAAQIDVWVPEKRQPGPIAGVVIRRDFADRLRNRRGTLSRIRTEDAVIDVGQHLDADDLVALVSEATRRRAVSLRRLGAVVEERSRIANRRLFRSLLADLQGIESGLEYAYQRDVERAHRLPPGRRQARLTVGTRSDVLYEDCALIVELDGRLGHLDGPFRDLRRDNAHALRGFLTLRFGAADVRGRPCDVARCVAAALARRGWPGPISACPRCEKAWAVGE